MSLKLRWPLLAMMRKTNASRLEPAIEVHKKKYWNCDAACNGAGSVSMGARPMVWQKAQYSLLFLVFHLQVTTYIKKHAA